jgi:hypothetical protein
MNRIVEAFSRIQRPTIADARKGTAKPLCLRANSASVLSTLQQKLTIGSDPAGSFERTNERTNIFRGKSGLWPEDLREFGI